MIFNYLEITTHIHIMATPSEIIKPSNINFDNITFGEKNTLPIGASFISLQYNGKPLYLQLPKATCFGMDKQYNDDENDSKNKRYTSTIRIEKMEEDSKMKECLEGLRDLEKHIKKYAKENSMDLFKKKKMSDEVIDTVFNDYLKSSKDKESGEEDHKSYYMKFKYPFKKNDEVNFDVGVFNSSKKSIDLTAENINTTIVKYCSVKAVITPNIYISSGKFGVTWKVWQVKVWEPEGMNVVLDKKNYCMIDSSDDEEEEEDDVANDSDNNSGDDSD